MKQVLKRMTIALLLIAFIISMFASDTDLKLLVLASALFVYPNGVLNKWVLVLLGGVFVYQILDIFVISPAIFNTTYDYLTFALCIMAVVVGLVYQFKIYKMQKVKAINYANQ